ncbi:hypothetical protein DFS34DRAFT_614128 [Phlyctochytrium arcticum]|nr:hypothetical protein DFS34DRAFT_614128 [Phlyctochytrium arcticum]
MTAVFNESLALPTKSPLTSYEPSIPNIQSRQYGFIASKPGETYNRQMREPFLYRKDKFTELEYVTKVEKDAVEAFLAVEKEKAHQLYFDELDEGNLLPRRNRKIVMPRSIGVQTNSDGTANIYHQPGYIRQQTNQQLGDQTKVVERPTDSRNPDKANVVEKNTILGQNHTVNLTDKGAQTSTEVGRIGSTNKVEIKSTDISPIQFPADSMTKDFRYSPLRDVKYPSPTEFKILSPQSDKFFSPLEESKDELASTPYEPPSKPESRSIGTSNTDLTASVTIYQQDHQVAVLEHQAMT